MANQITKYTKKILRNAKIYQQQSLYAAALRYQYENNKATADIDKQQYRQLINKNIRNLEKDYNHKNLYFKMLLFYLEIKNTVDILRKFKKEFNIKDKDFNQSKKDLLLLSNDLGQYLLPVMRKASNVVLVKSTQTLFWAAGFAIQGSTAGAVPIRTITSRIGKLLGETLSLGVSNILDTTYDEYNKYVSRKYGYVGENADLINLAKETLHISKDLKPEDQHELQQNAAILAESDNNAAEEKLTALKNIFTTIQKEVTSRVANMSYSGSKQWLVKKINENSNFLYDLERYKAIVQATYDTHKNGENTKLVAGLQAMLVGITGCVAIMGDYLAPKMTTIFGIGGAFAGGLTGSLVGSAALGAATYGGASVIGGMACGIAGGIFGRITGQAIGFSLGFIMKKAGNTSKFLLETQAEKLQIHDELYLNSQQGDLTKEINTNLMSLQFEEKLNFLQKKITILDVVKNTYDNTWSCVVKTGGDRFTFKNIDVESILQTSQKNIDNANQEQQQMQQRETLLQNDELREILSRKILSARLNMKLKDLGQNISDIEKDLTINKNYKSNKLYDLRKEYHAINNAYNKFKTQALGMAKNKIRTTLFELDAKEYKTKELIKTQNLVDFIKDKTVVDVDKTNKVPQKKM